MATATEVTQIQCETTARISQDPIRPMGKQAETWQAASDRLSPSEILRDTMLQIDLAWVGPDNLQMPSPATHCLFKLFVLFFIYLFAPYISQDLISFPSVLSFWSCTQVRQHTASIGTSYEHLPVGRTHAETWGPVAAWSRFLPQVIPSPRPWDSAEMPRIHGTNSTASIDPKDGEADFVSAAQHHLGHPLGHHGTSRHQDSRRQIYTRVTAYFSLSGTRACGAALEC